MTQTHHRTRVRPRVATLVAAAVLAAVGLARGGALSSAALLTDHAGTAGSTVTSGAVDLTLSHGAAAGTWLGSVTLSSGATVYARLTVTNAATVPLRYAVTATATSDTIASQLVTGVAVLAPGATNCDAAGFSAGTPLATSIPFGSVARTLVIGDPAVGPQPGDRSLVPAASEELCLKVAVPSSVPSGIASTTFDFSAENA
jgi:hypothetical protein